MTPNLKNNPNTRPGLILCVAGIFIVGLTLGFFTLHQKQHSKTAVIQPTDTTKSANAIDNIYCLIDQGNYTEALQLIDQAMADTIIPTDLSVAEREYKQMLIDNRIEEVTWLKITILCNTHPEEGLAQLRTFVHKKSPYQHEAQKLLNKITTTSM